MSQRKYLIQLLSVLIFSYTNLMGQTDNTITECHQLLVSNWETNFLYIGLDNPLQIMVTGIADEDLRINLDGLGTITQDSTKPHYYILHVNTAGRCAIDVEAKINGRMIYIGRKEFRMKRVTACIAMTTGGMQGGSVCVEDMKTQLGLKSMITGLDIDAGFSITGFNMIFITDGKVFKEHSIGAAFTPRMKEYLNRAKPNDVIFFEDINSIGLTNEPEELNHLAFYLQ
jgi:hypothetical protein